MDAQKLELIHSANQRSNHTITVTHQNPNATTIIITFKNKEIKINKDNK